MALAPWPFYLVGSVVVLVGFGFLHRWVQGLTGRFQGPPGSVLAASVVAFLLGSGTIVVGIVFDSEQLQLENTRIFVYDVDVEFAGPGPIHLVLPAPADERLLPFLGATNGTSTLTVNRTGSTPVVEISAAESVSFFIRVEFVGRALNTTLSQVAPDPGGGNATLVSILLQDADPGQGTADVRLDIRFTEFCVTTSVHLVATVQEGSAPYSATRDATPTC